MKDHKNEEPAVFEVFSNSNTAPFSVRASNKSDTSSCNTLHLSHSDNSLFCIYSQV